MARSEGKRPEPRKRVPAKPAPKRPNLPAAEVEQKSSGLGKKVLIAGVGLAVLAGLNRAVARPRQRDGSGREPAGRDRGGER